jgi:hypothetical protein
MLKAKLTIQLLANDVLVAELEDDKLWRKVLAAMQGGAQPDADTGEETFEDTEKDLSEAKSKPVLGVKAFASELKLPVETVQGSCAPVGDEPYLHLDSHCWESFKKNTPARGPQGIGPLQLAGTLICLWFKHAGIEGRPTQAQAQAVLGTIGMVDKNPSRAMKNCEWLQMRAGSILINPAKVSKAIAVAKAYCSQKPLEVV